MSEDLSRWTGREPPEPVTLCGSYCQIVPCEPTKHGPELWEALGGSPANEAMRYFPNPAFGNVDDFTNWLSRSGERGWLTLVFSRNGEEQAAGMGSFMRTDAANGATEIGAIVHAPALARSRAATQVHYLLCAYVFDTLGYRRYEWKLDNRNTPSHAAAQRFGFTFEGVFRQHMVVKGQNRDTAWYAMTDTDWPGVKAAFEDWLDPENFDASGGQIRKLADLRAQMEP